MSQSINGHWTIPVLPHRRVDPAAPFRQDEASSGLPVTSAKSGRLGIIWYLIPVLWLVVAVVGYVVLVRWPALFA